MPRLLLTASLASALVLSLVAPRASAKDGNAGPGQEGNSSSAQEANGAAAQENQRAPVRESNAAPQQDSTAWLSQRILHELPSAQALPDLYRLFERRDETPDLRLLSATLEAAARDAKARADVRALALELRGQLAVSEGQLVQARALFDEIAPVRSWALIGPFENEGRAGLAAAYGPETDGYNPAKSYQGKEHDVVWRTLPEAESPFGFIDLSGAISPHQNVAVYAATLLRAARAQRVVLHLGTSGAVRVWLNGKLVHEDLAQHPSRFDQAVLVADLAAGDNALFIKIAQATGKLGFSLRLCDDRDAPLPALAKTARAPGEPSRAFATSARAERTPAQRRAAKKLRDALGDLRLLARRNPHDARAQEDLGILLSWRRPDDDDERLPLHALERANEADPGDPEIALRLSHLEDRDANKKRAALEVALSKHPADASLLDALASYRLERGEGWQALALCEKARASAPQALEPMLQEARALDAVGLSARAALVRLEAVRAHANLPRAHREAATALRRLGRLDESEAELKIALAERFDDADSRAELTGLMLDRGQLDRALRLLGEAASLEPLALYPRVRAAELLSQNGRADEAERAFGEAVLLSPDDPEVHEQLGRHRLRKADDAGALAAFARALSLRPQNPALRELVRSVRPEEQYATSYLYDARELARKEPILGEDLEVLSDLSVTKVFANGLSSRTRQLIVRPLTQRGVDQARSQSVQYSPDRQAVKVERARIYAKDGGAVFESKSEGDRSLSEPWYGLYYDLRARVVSFSQLQPGDVVELVTRLDDSGSNFFADYFGDFAYLQGTSDRRISDYVLLGPPGRSFYASASSLPGLVHTEGKLQDGGTFQRWTAKDVPKLVPEPSMPGYSELLAYVHVSTYKDWESVGRFYWGLVKDQLRVTDEIRSAATEAVKGLPETDEPGRIRAVYDFVVSRTRYVGLEFGINSFKPYPVETILSRRFGDCKDKASLMHAMLESIGIDSRLALLRMSRMGTIAQTPASLAVFNHAILYLPKYKLFLDGTAEFHGSGELPADDRGADALIVEPSGEGSTFLTTPDAAPKDNSDTALSQVRLAADGSATLIIATSAQGSWTPELRRVYESPDERRAHAEESLARLAYPGIKVESIEVSDPHQIEKPFTTRVQATLPAFAARAGLSLRFSPLGQRQSFVEAYAQLSQRALPERLPAPQKTTLSAEVELPAGWLATLPEPVQEKSAQGWFSLTYLKSETGLAARLELEMTGGQLKAADYPAFRAFLGRLDAALLRKVVAAPPATAMNERH